METPHTFIGASLLKDEQVLHAGENNKQHTSRIYQSFIKGLCPFTACPAALPTAGDRLDTGLHLHIPIHHPLCVATRTFAPPADLLLHRRAVIGFFVASLSIIFLIFGLTSLTVCVMLALSYRRRGIFVLRCKKFELLLRQSGEPFRSIVHFLLLGELPDEEISHNRSALTILPREQAVVPTEVILSIAQFSCLGEQTVTVPRVRKDRESGHAGPEVSSH